jgi:hypothetical protein
MVRAKPNFSLGALALAGMAACASSTPSLDDRSSSSEDAGVGTTPAAQATDDYVPTEADFACLSTWTQVRKMRITNPVSDTAKNEALAIATRSQSGVEYPVGTIVQIIPTHAMAKRRAGFNTRGNDWEFFVLDVSDAGTHIEQRGGAEVTAPQIGSCQQCHTRAKSYDFLCEESHGCKSNGHTPAELVELQADDPRCAGSAAN